MYINRNGAQRGMIVKEFAKILRKLRREREMTQEELANILTYKKSTICNWERGVRVPRIRDLKKLASVFNVTVDYLVGKSSEKRGRLVTIEELREFVPEEVLKKHKIEILVDEEVLSIETKYSILQTLIRDGYLRP